MDKIFAPRSRAMDERAATYQQEDFKYGVYDDIPTNEIPTRGIAYQTNYSNRSTHLETRTGTKEYGDDLTDPDNPVVAASIPNVFENVTVIATSLEPYTITYAIPVDNLGFVENGVDINGWFIGRIDDSGKAVNDKIIHYEADGVGNFLVQVATGVDVDITDVEVEISLSAPVYGLYASKREDRCVMQVGGQVYVSTDLFMTEWQEAVFFGETTGGSDDAEKIVLDASRSTIRELDGAVYIFNSNGIYKVSFSAKPATFIKVNTDTPKGRLIDINESDINPEEPADETYRYGRKRVYSFCRLSGDGARNRMSEGATLEWESGGVKVPESSADKDIRDYAVEWRTDEQDMLDATDNIVNLRFDDSNSLHATHFSSYATRNISLDSTVDENTSLITIGSDNAGVYDFTSVDVIGSLALGSLVEVLGVSEPFTLTQLNSDGVAGQLTGTTGLLTVGNDYNMATTVITAGIAGGNNPEELIWELDIPLIKNIKITTTSESSGTYGFTSTFAIDRMWIGTTFTNPTLGTVAIASLNADGLSGTLTANAGIALGVYPISAGAGDIVSATVTGTDIVFDSVVDLHVGQPLFFENDTTRYVISTPSQTTCQIDKDLPSTLEPPQIICYNPTGIDKINSEVKDYDITVRSETMSMIGRFWQPLINSNLGEFLTGFCMVTKAGQPMVEYCQLSTGYEYLMGQHNKFYQYTKLDDNVRDITGFNGLFSIKCDGSTKAINSISYVSSGNPDVGRFVFVLSTITDVSKNIGVVGAWCSIKIDGDTSEWVLTSEPALRMFDGKVYSENFLERRMMNRLRNLSTQFSLGFHPQFGLVIWGIE